MRKSARRGTTAGRKAEKSGALGKHRARCRICRHPDREEIEREFLDWTSAREIAATWKMASYRAVYRHARAMGLFDRRRKNWQAALDRIIERVSEVQVTASAVIAAIRLSARLDRERSETAGRRGSQPGFVLSLEGLPRIDAVTGRRNPMSQAKPAPAQPGSHAGRHRAVGAGLKPAPANSGRGDRAPTNDGGNKAHDTSGSGTPRRVPAAGGQSAASPAPAATAAGRNREAAAAKKSGKPETQGHKPPVAPGRVPLVPPKSQPAPAHAEKDPRIALGQDGQVAGMPWPWKEKKITFAPRRRWRPAYHPSG